jgi:hypothetical protein
MTSQRPAALALVAASLLALAGCRTAGVNDLLRPDLASSRPKESAADLLADHNRNAEQVKGLTAYPAVQASRRLRVGALSGRLALDGRRNFKLELDAPGGLSGKAADIGSNETEFWFWVKDSEEKAVYYCNYDETGASPLAVSFQPDWIIEALGLHVVSDEEAAQIEVSRGQVPGKVILTRREKSPRGGEVVKETVLSEPTRRIQEHSVYSAGKKILLARATLSDYQTYPVGPKSTDPAAETVYLPGTIKLEWPREKLALVVSMGKRVTVNPVFSDAKRHALFVEPVFPDFARVNLADRAGVEPASATTVRETMPAPPPRIRLSNPKPLGSRGLRRNPLDPAEVVADSRPVLPVADEEVVGPPIPTVPGLRPESSPGWGGWRGGKLPVGIEQ